MKYEVTAITENEKEYTVMVSVKRTAKMKTVFLRCMNEIGNMLIKAKVIPEDARFCYDLPNIWRNGHVGAAWFCEPYINVAIQEETGAWIAL